MKRLLVILALVGSVLVAACGGTPESGESTSFALGAPEPAPAAPAPEFASKATADFAAPSAVPAPPAASASAPRAAASAAAQGEAGSPGTLETVDRKIISTASLSIEVEVVREAVAQVRVIAESLGGFIEQMSLSGDDEHQRAFVNLRVPQEQFSIALERLEALGKVRSQSLGSEDVSERFIDLEAQLKSALRKEESLLSLLERATNVSEILSIERELSRVRTEIERTQGRLNFLERRVALGTISVSLFPPDAEVTAPPSASLSIAVRDVTGSVEGIRGFVAGVDGTLDRVSLSVRDGRESAQVSLRVFPADFTATLAIIEALGEVTVKSVQEITSSEGEEAKPPEKPNARISFTLVESEGTRAVIVAGIAVLVGLVLAGLLGLFRLTYRAGRRSA